MVLTLDVQHLLRTRPVERGQVLFTVADTQSGWKLRTRVPQDRIGHVVAAQQQSPPITARFKLTGDPKSVFAGHVTTIRETAVLDTQELASELPDIEVDVAVDAARASLGPPGDGSQGAAAGGSPVVGLRLVSRRVGQPPRLAGILIPSLKKEKPLQERRPLIFVLSTCVVWSLAAISTHAAEGIVVNSVVLSPLEVAEVPAQQTGVLQEILAREGAVVAEGEVLARLDARQATLDVAQAELESDQAEARATNRIRVEFAEKSLAVAQAELARSQESISQFAKSISQSQLDVEQLTIEKLTLERAQAEHERELDHFAWKLRQQEVAAARLRLAQHTVEAPFAGTVALIRGRRGEWVELGAPVVRLVAIEKLRAEGFLDVEHLAAGLVGSSVLFRSGTGAEATESRGTLQFVSPEMDPVTRQVRVWAEIANPAGKLRSGQQGTLEIVSRAAEH